MENKTDYQKWQRLHKYISENTDLSATNEILSDLGVDKTQHVEARQQLLKCATIYGFLTTLNETKTNSPRIAAVATVTARDAIHMLVFAMYCDGTKRSKMLEQMIDLWEKAAGGDLNEILDSWEIDDGGTRCVPR